MQKKKIVFILSSCIKSFFCKIFCDDKKKYFFLKPNSSFYILIEYIWIRFLRQKTPKNIIVKSVTLNAIKSVTKHIHLTLTYRIHLDTIFTPKNAENMYVCEKCNKQYKFNSGLWKHKQKCNNNIKYKKNNENDTNFHSMFMAIMEKNNELQTTLLEVLPKIGDTTNSHNTNNFNINVFLNEQCKDAINIMDFVNSLQLKLKDLECMGKLGFVEGTSKIFINGLKELELHKRPIHCSNINSETLYVKDNDTWEKENDNKDKMKKAIDGINKANIKQIPHWILENPTYTEDEEYMKIISNVIKMDIEEDKNKIINNVAKETLIDE